MVLLYDRTGVAACGAVRPRASLAHLTAGRRIGVDAEFVAYEKMQIEFCSDGSQTIARPSKMRLARLSLVDASTRSCILDEFVAVRAGEEIADYWTAVSGIRPEDLLPGTSERTLSTRKSLMVRFQGLADAGCVFVGHGLENDFCVFNVSIAREQIIDTVELYHLPGSRFVSLKFLYWHFFGERIQTGSHDSVEDSLAVRPAPPELALLDC